MGRFLLYLFESGLCLAILYSVYVLFFRKETYFNFNRFYLTGIMILSLVIPIVHVNIAVSSIDKLEEPISDIADFRTYYTDFLALSEGDFGNSAYSKYRAAEFESAYNVRGELLPMIETAQRNEKKVATESIGSRFPINPFKLFIVVYLIGVLVYLMRLIILLVKLARAIKKNQIEKHLNYKLVLMEKEVPPFSFFNYIFINQKAKSLKELGFTTCPSIMHLNSKGNTSNPYGDIPYQ